jgi:mono/diheme cytochrome c family protein
MRIRGMPIADGMSESKVRRQPIMMRLACHVAFAASLMTGIVAGSFNAQSARTPQPPQPPQPREDYNSGVYLYRAFCASCHGDSGRGDGPAASTLARPTPDLTSLSRAAGGVFPRDRVRAVLDGKVALPDHDRSAMPAWRHMFNRLEHGDDSVVQKRLEALIAHLESLQTKR